LLMCLIINLRYYSLLPCFDSSILLFNEALCAFLFSFMEDIFVRT